MSNSVDDLFARIRVISDIKDEEARAKQWAEMLLLVEVKPELAARKNKDGQMPLHVALQAQAPQEVLSRVLQAHPEAAQACDDEGWMAIHYAVRRKSFHARTDRGGVAFREGVSCKPSNEFISELLAVCPQALRKQGLDGNVVLHEALIFKAPVQMLMLLLKTYPDAAKVKNKYSWLPVHDAMRHNAPLPFVKELLSLYPEGAQEKDAFGKDFLRLGFEARAPKEDLLCLLEEYPASAKVGDNKGRLLLHYAVTRGATSLPLVMKLLELYPGSVQETDEDGYLPLHLALESGNTSIDVLREVFNAFPDAAKIECRDVRHKCLRLKSTTLGLAATHLRHDQAVFVEELVAYYPEAVRIKDSDGFLPLYRALDNFPSSYDIDKEFDPAWFNQVAYYDHVLLTLILADLPSSLFEEEEEGKLNSQEQVSESWTLLMDHPTTEPKRVQFLVESVFKLLQTLPAAHKKLAKSKDDKGREAISICHADVRASMNKYLLFLGRYELQQGAPIHKSATALVRYARDHSHEPSLRVALKFMQQRDPFEREVSSRTNSQLDGAHVLDVTRSYNGDDDLDANFLQGLSRLGLSEYRYCLVLPAADRSLKEIIDKERIAGGRDVEVVRSIALQLARALEHLHSRWRIHGDIKPLNVVRVGADIKLIDLDASALIDVEHAASKWSSAYLPPELIAQDCSVKQGQVLATASFDMWSYGCVLFQLFTGEPLWLANDEDNIAELDDLRLLHEWKIETKMKKLAKIKDNKNARNLCSQLLSFCPNQRPASMAHVLSHPFFTGHAVGRLPGEEAEFDVFLSYRVDSDLQHAEQLYDLLVSKGLKVWWDKKCLLPGVSWEAGFCAGLVKSRSFVPLLSKKAIKSRFEGLAEGSGCDNVLLEYRLSVELADRGLLERTYPVMIGDVDSLSGEYGNYFAQGCHPSASSLASIVVRKVEEKLTEHLETQGLGLPMREGMSVKAVLDAITVNQGGFVQGSTTRAHALLDAQANIIVAMVHQLNHGGGEVGGGGGGGGGQDEGSTPVS